MRALSLARACAPALLLASLLPGPSAHAAMVALDLCRLKPVFMEEFDNLSVAARDWHGVRWTAHTPWNGDFGDATFIDPGLTAPFTVHDGVLSITARKGPDGHWQSGLIAAADGSGAGIGVRYGYFEARMQMPPGPGTWPAFWLGTLRPTGAPGPGIELDVVEYYGHDAGAYQAAVHVWDADPKTSRHEAHTISVPAHALTTGFHSYGVRVAPDVITFYLDRQPTWQVDTPPELKAPLFPLVDLALGSGFPIVDTPNPSVLLVDYVHIFGFDPAVPPGSCPPAAP